METDSSDAYGDRDSLPAYSPPYSTDYESARVLSLDGQASRSERLAIKAVRAARRAVPAALILLGDFGALLASGEAAIWLRHLVDPTQFPFGFYPALLVYSALMVVSYAAVGLYAPVAPSSPDELRRLSLTTTTLALIMTIVTYVSRGQFDVGVSMYLMAWGLALFTVPLARAAVRGLFAKRAWWSRKAIVLSPDLKSACRVVKAVKRDPRLGLRPVAILSTGDDSEHAREAGLPQLRGLGPALEHERDQGVDYAILSLSLLNNDEGLSLIRKYETYFKHWLLVPFFPHGYSLWVSARDLNGTLGLELTHRLLRRGDQIIKRTMDLGLTMLGSVFVLPLSLLIALAIKLDSRGPVLYSQVRLGRDGREFRAFKFRSMVQDADRILFDYLEAHPELREEWEATQKLKNDPRITWLGRFLRKTSLDELPQLINVLRGEMSLVGPRPIVEDEIARYEQTWALYKRVRPGITGQWQISGRSETSYKERTAMDAYYVRNWSVWLDLYILARTVTAVLRRDGAY